MGLGGIESSNFVVALVLLAVALAMYFLPMIIAVVRNHPNAVALTALNLLLGWTLLGWVAALVWALLAKPAVKTSEPDSEKAKVSRYEELERLAKLREAGHIDEQEYISEKKKLLI